MNIGIIGSGFIVAVFVKNSKLLKDFKLYGIWGRHLEKIKAFEGFKLYTTDIDELVNDPNIDVVYVAIPNALHYEYALKALKAKKHVMLEKPFCNNYSQTKKLVDYAKKNKLFLYETAMTIHSPNYQKAKKYVKNLGEIKMVEVNFSQYSRRYERFKNGIMTPAFDKKLAGGSLMDLGIYSIHFVTNIFGMPNKVYYHPNMIKGVDTSGVAVLDYKSFKATLIHAKDCGAKSYAVIQGDKGYIRCNSTPSRCASFDVVSNDGKTITISSEDNEFAGWKTMYGDFVKMYKKKDYETCYKLLNQTLLAQKVLDEARINAGIDIG